MKVPNASSKFDDFICIGMKTSILTVCMVMDSAVKRGKKENTCVV